MTTNPDPASSSARLGHFRIVRKLDEGGMGVIHEAIDERLGRRVALKRVRPSDTSAEARERLWREARAAASFSHPNICQLYDIGEADGELFLALELLEGESLATRIGRGPLTPSEAVPILLAALSGLGAIHRRGLVHRDLKPSNVFLSPVGVKLLDFGLARASSGDGPASADVTQTGVLVGTPRYLAPEQIAGGVADARTDLFAVGAILFEMLSGRPAFEGRTVVEVLHAIGHGEPPALGGSPAVAALDRAIQHALAKDPARRFESADAMADALREALLLEATGESVRAAPILRLIVLPFRILRPDPETDFLAFSLPDALSSTLSGLGSLVVRSTHAARSNGGDGADLEAVARQADVNAVLTGTVMRAGDQIRVVAQLVETPRGTVSWSHTAQVSLGDVFQLQDSLAQRILESLSGTLSARDQGVLHRDVPSSPQAYELYLRANALAGQSSQWSIARGLYERCLELDPDFAPAWARLGRLLRLLAAYTKPGGEDLHPKSGAAFLRALELNPDLPVAHHYYTHLEVEVGRARKAMVRLLGQAARRADDPEILAGLVQACRFCGLNEVAVAAWERARRLDPDVRTSASHALFMLGEYARATEANCEEPPIVVPHFLILQGREEEALVRLRAMEAPSMPWVMREMVGSQIDLLTGRREEALARIRAVATSWDPRDPCPRYYVARQLAATGDAALALDHLERVVGGGFVPLPLMRFDPYLDLLRGDPRFQVVARRAEELKRVAVAAYVEAGGDRILGVAAPR